MVILTCPHCGERNVTEFRYGGEFNPRPKEPLLSADADWADFIYMRDNRLGVQIEWWYHQAGCGVWFIAKRHTKNNQVESTYLWTKRA